tara:strand:+ start:678 stop:1010 length:333 start_codon:yes stop_codon:yes gene_type:complete
MYKIPKYRKSRLKGAEKLEGEPIEWKIERVLNNKEPITDGAPAIFTERADGVGAGYNIRTDRWELAVDAMDLVTRNKEAKREAKAEKREAKVIEMKTEADLPSAVREGEA